VGPNGTRVLAAEARWREVERWHRETATGERYLVFCASMADVFEEWSGQMTDVYRNPLSDTLDDARRRLWKLIQATPRLTWQLLTKRPENIGRMMPHGDWPNVWLGTSIETQECAGRADDLLRAPQRVPVRFVSAEPLLGPLDLRAWLNGIAWVIVGGESGSQARSMNCDWARQLIEQCRAAKVACFVKQLGKTPIAGRYPLTLITDPRHHGDPDDWPADLRVREFPA